MNLLVDLIGMAGFAAVSYGAWMAWPPAGFIVGGVLLLAYAVKAAPNVNSQKGDE